MFYETIRETVDEVEDRINEINDALSSISELIKMSQPNEEGMIRVMLFNCEKERCLGCPHSRWFTTKSNPRSRSGNSYIKIRDGEPWKYVKKKGEFYEGHEKTKQYVSDFVALEREKKEYIESLSRLNSRVAYRVESKYLSNMGLEGIEKLKERLRQVCQHIERRVSELPEEIKELQKDAAVGSNVIELKTYECGKCNFCPHAKWSITSDLRTYKVVKRPAYSIRYQKLDSHKKEQLKSRIKEAEKLFAEKSALSSIAANLQRKIHNTLEDETE